jgi:hypothetical protein
MESHNRVRHCVEQYFFSANLCFYVKEKNTMEQCCEFEMFIPDPEPIIFFVSRIRIRPSFIPDPGTCLSGVGSR